LNPMDAAHMEQSPTPAGRSCAHYFGMTVLHPV
jgi:hypothetical protein